jgi:hypothetical protein
MKKYLLLASVAALAFTSCSDQSTEFVGDEAAQKAREISFSPVARPTTRAAVDGSTFTPNTMQVTAYDVTNTREFFAPTTFTKASTTWKGGKYWPLSAAYINFWAYSELEASATPTLTWNATATTATWALEMTDNKTAQKDLMYAIGNGAVTKSGNALSFNGDAAVSMTFIHAQSWISFYADAYDATSGGKVTLNSITLNGAKYNGTYTITFTNYNASSSQSVTGAWSALGSTQDVAVPNWTAAAIAYDGTGNGVVVGDGLMIVPDDNNTTPDFANFTINYTLDGKTYDYVYTPADLNVDQAKHYIYNINFHLHEIEIAASVTDWADQTAVDVPIF